MRDRAQGESAEKAGTVFAVDVRAAAFLRARSCPTETVCGRVQTAVGTAQVLVTEAQA